MNHRETPRFTAPSGTQRARDWHHAWHVDAESLTDRLEIWLSETGWYEEDTGEDDAMRPWEPARTGWQRESAHPKPRVGSGTLIS